MFQFSFWMYILKLIKNAKVFKVFHKALVV